MTSLTALLLPASASTGRATERPLLGYAHDVREGKRRPPCQEPLLGGAWADQALPTGRSSEGLVAEARSPREKCRGKIEEKSRKNRGKIEEKTRFLGFSSVLPRFFFGLKIGTRQRSKGLGEGGWRVER